MRIAHALRPRADLRYTTARLRDLDSTSFLFSYSSTPSSDELRMLTVIMNLSQEAGELRPHSRRAYSIRICIYIACRLQ